MAAGWLPWRSAFAWEMCAAPVRGAARRRCWNRRATSPVAAISPSRPTVRAVRITTLLRAASTSRPATRDGMTLIDGKAIAQRIDEKTRAAVADITARGIKPGLAVVIVGDDPASHAYVRNKERTAKDLAMHSVKRELPWETTQE